MDIREASFESRIVPGQQNSYWIASTEKTAFVGLERELEVDVAVVGAGITGITVAALLKDRGKSVALIEANRIAAGVTGNTTAKITALQSLAYQHLLTNFSRSDVRDYASANQSAIDKIEELIGSRKIDCDFKRTPSFTYTEITKNKDSIKKEAESAEKAGLAAVYAEKTPLPFEVAGAVKLENQAQFHPRKFLLALAKDIPDEHNFIFEETRALNLEDGNPCRVITASGVVKAEKVVLATHFPFWDKGMFFARLFPYHAYAVALSVEGRAPEGIYYTEDGSHHSIRSQPQGNGELLIIGGGSHKAGQGGDVLKRYAEVEKYAYEKFKVKSLKCFWSTMDYDSADGMPFIGRSPRAKNVYLATGYGGWGMTNGVLGAMILSDLLTGETNDWERLFQATRIKPFASALDVMKESIDIGARYAGAVFKAHKTKKPSELGKGEAEVLEIDHTDVAVYRDSGGEIQALSAKCTHMGCRLNWNNAELTWDCPCHGSRFSNQGEVIHGPALGVLIRKEIED